MRAGLAAIMLLALAAFSAPSGATMPAPDPVDKIEPAALLEATASETDTTFWAILSDEADLSRAPSIGNRADRGEFVMDQLQQVAEESQTGLRSLLMKRGITHKPFWIINAVQITADETVLQEVAARPEVERILASRTYDIPKPTEGTEEPSINAVEWNIDRVRAPLVWSTFGVRGEGIVVANVDSGVQFDHPALVAQYRGNLGSGVFDHNYNWFDPSEVCGNPSLVPCDNNDHGTHTMGTILGDDGDPGANQVGVAPAARWIAAKGCETNFCSDQALLESGQWMLAPTDLTGQNPRPDLRPHIVNNSWGGPTNDTFYQAIVDAWNASGIFPVFSNGNTGPGCATSSAPGAFINSYSAGAFDINNNIASFSSRGASFFGGEIKPNIAAPGVNVRSSVPDNTYAAFNGTSMAAPHVTGTVALMWSAAPALERDITETRALLDSTAIDTSNLTCGGTAADNNVWGEGRLDTFAAVDQSPRGPIGTLTGTVTNSTNGTPIAGATVSAVGPVDRVTTTDANGFYALTLPIGTYDVTGSLFGFVDQTVTGVIITEGATTTQDLALTPAATHQVSGHVRDADDNPVANATVTIIDTPIPPATTDANGSFSFANVPEGAYDVHAAAGRCNDPQTQHLVVDGDETLDFALPNRTDSFGYFCQLLTPAYIEATTVVPPTGDDTSAPVTLPFPFPFYGETYSTAHVGTNGFINFLAPSSSRFNGTIPQTTAPNGAIYVFWDDTVVDSNASVRTALLGSVPNRMFVIEWRNVHIFSDTTRRMDFEVVLHENGFMRTEYRNIAVDVREQGNSATLGIENETGTVALQYSSDQAVINSPTFAVLYRPPPSGQVTGTVTDANDGLGVAGATVQAIQGGTVVHEATTNANGVYVINARLGTYTIAVTATNYASRSAEVVLDVDGETVTQDFTLQTPRGEVSPAALQVIATPDQVRIRTLTLANSGTLPMTWSISEQGGDAPWLSEDPTIGQLDPGASTSIQVTVDSAGLAPGVYNAVLVVQTNSGRQPQLPVPVRLIVPAYFQSVNAAGLTYSNADGDVWSADQPYAAGTWGHVGRSRVRVTSEAISGTSDPALYQGQRERMLEYRFDGLPDGVYEIELRFAELLYSSPGRRQFDITAENTTLMVGYDIVLWSGGRYVADDHVFFVEVTDGQLNLRFVERKGFGVPVVNAIMIRERPDR